MLHDATEELNQAILSLEDVLHERHANPAMVALSMGRHLSWDGEFLWMINKASKQRLVDCSRAIRVEACSKVRELGERTGVLR
jgi:hypothetical protein